MIVNIIIFDFIQSITTTSHSAIRIMKGNKLWCSRCRTSTKSNIHFSRPNLIYLQTVQEDRPNCSKLSIIYKCSADDVHWSTHPEFTIMNAHDCRIWYSLIFQFKRLNRNHLSGILTPMISSCVRRLKIRELNDPDNHGSSFRTYIVELAWIGLKPTHNQDKNTPWKLHWGNPWFFLRVYFKVINTCVAPGL